MIPYSRHTVTEADISTVVDVMRSPWLTQGPMVRALEAKLRVATGAQYAVAVSSGTAALWCAYRATAEIRNATKVHTTPISFMATANAALLAGLEVVFHDLDSPETGELLTFPDDDGIVAPVWMRGSVPDTWTWSDTPVETGVVVDGCHCLGAANLPTSIYDAVCISLHPSKAVAAGEGGAVLTDNKDIAVICRSLRDHGREDRQMTRLGFNCRMDEMSAALAYSQMDRLQEGVDRRRNIAGWYDRSLKAVPGLYLIPHDHNSAFHLYQVRIDDAKLSRGDLRVALLERGIDTQVHYRPITSEPWWQTKLGDQKFPNAEMFAAQVLAIPMYAGLTASERLYVSSTLLDLLS